MIGPRSPDRPISASPSPAPSLLAHLTSFQPQTPIPASALEVSLLLSSVWWHGLCSAEVSRHLFVVYVCSVGIKSLLALHAHLQCNAIVVRSDLSAWYCTAGYC